MSCDLIALAAAGVQGLSPYQPGKPVEELERDLGIRNIIKLASNENPLGPSPVALQAARTALADVTRYPDGSGYRLKRKLAGRLGVDESGITLGNGSNDLLEFIARVWLGPGTECIFSAHAFAVYPLVTQAAGARAVVVPAKDWGHDLAAMADAVTDATRVIFIANPNNPTGTWLKETEVRDFLDRIPQRVVVVLDEAYFEYGATEAGYPNGIEFLADYPNLIVTRTFSKAWGLAGLRVGYGISSAAIADLLNRVRQPFNVNSAALAAAEAVLDDTEYLQRSIDVNQSGLAQLADACTQHELNWIPSLGNFLAIDFGREAMPLYEALLREGLIVRPVANYAMPNFLRVSVGLPEENSRFIEALGKVLAA